MSDKRPTYRFRGHINPEALERRPIKAEVQSDSTDGVATIRLLDPIDSWGDIWGVSAKEFNSALDDLGDNVNEIRLHINSPGGEVFEGVAILNALRAHPARVHAIVDGLAASAASVIACGADELTMGRNTRLMIHDAWGVCVGNAADMRDLAGALDGLSDDLAAVYAAKSGGDVTAWREVMRGEAWYSAREAVEAGLADRVDGDTDEPEDDAAGGEAARFDTSGFKYADRSEAPAPPTPNKTTDADDETEAPPAGPSELDRVLARMGPRSKTL